MYIDLNVPVPLTATGPAQSKKSKGKQPKQVQQPSVVFTPAQIDSLESRLDILEHLGYNILGLNQTVQKKIDPKTHVNTLDPLLLRLRKRDRVTFVKRLTIVLDEESEKGFGLTSGNASIVAPYDIISLLPTTATTFSQACLSHTVPSNLTAHIISLPLTLPRLPFNLKHTQVRTAIKNGAVFEISYAGALGGDSDSAMGVAGASEGGSGAKRNWWASAREVIRVSKGKGLIVTGGVTDVADLRAPRDVGNLISMLDLAQNIANDASTKTPQSLILRAQTRKTYRAVFSEPRVVVPDRSSNVFAAQIAIIDPPPHSSAPATESVQQLDVPATITTGQADALSSITPGTVIETATTLGDGNGRKRAREDDDASGHTHVQSADNSTTSKKKKKKKSQP